MGYSNRIFNYIPERIQVSIDAYTVSGLIGVRVIKDQPTFKTIKGIRGKNTRVRQLDEAYMIELELQQVDPVNNFLSDLHALDKESGDVGYFQFRIIDLNGTTRFYTDNAYVESIPEFNFSTDLNDRTWVIRTLDTTGVLLGGNDIVLLSPNFKDVNTRARL